MAEACALCGAVDPDRKVYPPREWVEYLRCERGLADPEGVLAVPLCGRCSDRVVPLRDAFERIEAFDEAGRERTREGVRSRLDRLDLDALADETGPSREERESLLGR